MPNPVHFLVVDDNPDSRFLLVKTLLRKFPSAVVHECQNAESAIELARQGGQTVIITHRAANMPGLELVQRLREVSRNIPIVMVSSLDRSEAAASAGASGFLLYDEWLRIGTVVADLIARQPAPRQAPLAVSAGPSKSRPVRAGEREPSST